MSKVSYGAVLILVALFAGVLGHHCARGDDSSLRVSEVDEEGDELDSGIVDDVPIDGGFQDDRGIHCDCL